MPIVPVDAVVTKKVKAHKDRKKRDRAKKLAEAFEDEFGPDDQAKTEEAEDSTSEEGDEAIRTPPTPKFAWFVNDSTEKRQSVIAKKVTVANLSSFSRGLTDSVSDLPEHVKKKANT